MAKVNYTEKHLQLAKIAKAMSHPARIFILEKTLRNEFMLLQR